MPDEVFDSTHAVDEFKEIMSDPAARQAFVELKAQHTGDGTRRRYQHIVRAVTSMPWAVLEDRLQVIIDVLAFRSQGGVWATDEIQARVAAARTREAAPEGEGGVAVISIHGVIIPRASAFDEMSGGVSLESLTNDLDAAMRAPEISSIVLDIDSPGGVAYGVPEFAERIRAARATKRITAVAAYEAGSAAYWIASQADEIVVTKSGQVGSIGVFAVHEDHSGELAAKGVVPTIIKAGKFKAEGNPTEPLAPEAKAYAQSVVDHMYAMFTADVAKGRGVPVGKVREGFGEGRMMVANRAIDEGLADRVGSTEQVIDELLRAGAREQRARMAAGPSIGEITGVTDDGTPFVARLEAVATDGAEAGQATVEVTPQVRVHTEMQEWLESHEHSPSCAAMTDTEHLESRYSMLAAGLTDDTADRILQAAAEASDETPEVDTADDDVEAQLEALLDEDVEALERPEGDDDIVIAEVPVDDDDAPASDTEASTDDVDLDLIELEQQIDALSDE